MHNFKELFVWEKSRKLVSDIYNLTKLFPKDERFGLISQMQRSAISIPSNIEEGAGRDSNKEFLRFLDIANGSSFELETQIYLAFDQNYISEEKQSTQIEKVREIQKMIYQLKKYFENNQIPTT
ncbi:MAG: four helix bundle protein [Bacteroidales bacterium]|nr:four helix bundle protein [Bacteroidales bacterium]